MTLSTVTCKAPLSTGFSRQEYCSGLPFPSLEDHPNPSIGLKSTHWPADSLAPSPQGSPQWRLVTALFTCSALSRVRLFVTLWAAALEASLSFTVSQSLLTLVPIESMLPPNLLTACCPLLLPSVFPSIKVFPNESALHIRWPDYWVLSFSISPSNEYSGLISFSTDWFDLLAGHLYVWCYNERQTSSVLTVFTDL